MFAWVYSFCFFSQTFPFLFLPVILYVRMCSHIYTSLSFPATFFSLSFIHTFTHVYILLFLFHRSTFLSLRFYTQVYIPPSFFSSYIPISVCAGADISGSAAAASPAGHRAGRHVLRHQKTAGQRHVRSIRGDAHRLHLCRVGDPRLLPKDLRNV